MNDETKTLVCDFVDYLLPALTPSETSLYLYLLRNSILKKGSRQIRIGKRTIADGYGTGSRGAKTNYQHITGVIKRLEENGCITVGDTTREGTLYNVILPREVPMVQEKIASLVPRTNKKIILPMPLSDLSSSNVTNGSVNTAEIKSQRKMPHLIITSHSPKEEHTRRPIYERVASFAMQSNLASPLKTQQRSS